MEVYAAKIELLSVDLDRHANVCLQFAADIDTGSFGCAAQHCDAEGKAGRLYIDRMRDKLAADPKSCLHAWRGEIVGQLNLGRFIVPSIGYISVFYVVPEWRGKAVADAMEGFAAEWFVKRGFASARLSVSPNNTRAVRFYLRRGWADLGPRPDRPDLHNMEKRFP